MESASRLPQYRQTEMQYFKDLRVLDPSQASSWTLSLADLLKLPLLQKVPEEQIVAYIDEITYSPYNYRIITVGQFLIGLNELRKVKNSARQLFAL